MNHERHAYEHATVLYSGGTDSTLAAVEMLKLCRKVTLLTFNPGFIFFVENSKVHAEALRRRYGEARVDHHIMPIADFTRRILFGDVKADLRRYGFDMTALVCMGCRLGMHARAIIYNLEHGIPVLADGSIEKQNAIPEQRPSVLRSNRELYFKRYGIRHLSPIYAETRSDIKLFEAGVSSKKRLKKQFILFETQATCPFGVTADVYARMFYKPLMGASTDAQSVEYCQRKHPLMHAVIERHFADRDLDLAALVSRLRSQHDAAEISGRAGNHEGSSE
jgi:hypothetical protein